MEKVKDDIAALQKTVNDLLVAGRVGLATDVDGTISPIAEIPSAAYVPEENRESLRRLQGSARFPVVAILSGRAALEARRMVGLPGLIYLGNHGMEILKPGMAQSQPVPAARPYQNLVAGVLETVQEKVQESVRPRPTTPEEDWRNGLLFENKGVTASIHYRLSPDPDQARAVLWQLINETAQPTGLRTSEGRMVIEIRPPVEANKGTALAWLVQEYRLNSLIFMGDDVTDVDGFRVLKRLEKEPGAAQPFRGLSIGVRSPEMPGLVGENADFLVDGVLGITGFLTWLASSVRPVPAPG